MTEPETFPPSHPCFRAIWLHQGLRTSLGTAGSHSLICGSLGVSFMAKSKLMVSARRIVHPPPTIEAADEVIE
jgi:hypothetical protein